MKWNSLPVWGILKILLLSQFFTSDLTQLIKPYSYHTVSFHVDVNTMLSYFNEAIFGKYMYVSLGRLYIIRCFLSSYLNYIPTWIDEYIITDYPYQNLYEATTLTGLDYTKQILSVEFLVTPLIMIWYVWFLHSLYPSLLFL